MKAKFFWAYVLVLAFSPFVNASPDSDDMVYTDNKVKEVREYFVGEHNTLVTTVDNHTAQINNHTAQIEELKASVNKLQAKVDILEKGAKNLENSGDKTDIKANVALWITIPIGMVICCILCLAFWPRRSKSSTINPTRSKQNKCPRCGWEHDPGDTVCKNPNCTIQF